MLLNFHSVNTNYTHTKQSIKSKVIWIKSNKLISELLNKATQYVGIVLT